MESNMNATVNLTSNEDQTEDNMEIFRYDYVIWIFLDSFLFLFIIFGNVLTILAITLNRELRNVTSNYFILNLALSDFFVGFTLLYHLAFYVNDSLNKIKLTCILKFIIISLACGGSICNVIMVAIDRYIAVVYPLKYKSCMTKKRVLLMIYIEWIYIISVATIPLFWNCYDPESTCEMETVLPRYYTVAILMPSFFVLWGTMFLLYWQIWKETSVHVRRLKFNCSKSMQINDWKSVQVVVLVLGCFSICWFPYLIVACTRTFDWKRKSTPILYKATFSLAIANSGMNPIIYAWKNTNFRKAFQRLIQFQSPNKEFEKSFCKVQYRPRTSEQMENKKVYSIMRMDTDTSLCQLNDTQVPEVTPL